MKNKPTKCWHYDNDGTLVIDVSFHSKSSTSLKRKITTEPIEVSVKIYDLEEKLPQIWGGTYTEKQRDEFVERVFGC